ncbi:MAG: hypothetical protein ACUVQY_10435 [Thermoproteota archaeon]
MLEKAKPSFKIALAGCASFLLALGLVYSLLAWSVYINALPETQYIDSTILVKDNRGTPVKTDMCLT